MYRFHRTCHGDEGISQGTPSVRRCGSVIKLSLWELDTGVSVGVQSIVNLGATSWSQCGGTIRAAACPPRWPWVYRGDPASRRPCVHQCGHASFKKAVYPSMWPCVYEGRRESIKRAGYSSWQLCGNNYFLSPSSPAPVSWSRNNGPHNWAWLQRPVQLTTWMACAGFPPLINGNGILMNRHRGDSDGSFQLSHINKMCWCWTATAIRCWPSIRCAGAGLRLPSDDVTSRRCADAGQRLPSDSGTSIRCAYAGLRSDASTSKRCAGALLRSDARTEIRCAGLRMPSDAVTSIRCAYAGLRLPTDASNFVDMECIYIMLIFFFKFEMLVI